jgi:polysaccharide export outer membrane protein
MKYLVVMAVTLFFTSCNIIPGSHISQDASPNTLFGDEPIVEANIILITPALIREIASNQPEPKTDPFFTSNSVLNDEYNYLIGVGDVLTVTVWERPELTIPFGQFRDASSQGNIVYDDGTIFFPYAGKVIAQGKTVVELREELTKKLDKYFENPQIDVKVAVFNSQRFYVTGSVNIPGTYPITNTPLRLLEAINQANGFGPDGDIYSVRLTRDGTPIEVPIYDMLYRGDLRANIIIKNGDVLHIAPDQQRRVFVMGEVNKSMPMFMPHKPLTLAQVIGEVGGINEMKANGSGIYVIRQTDVPEIVNVFQLDITEAYTLGLADSFIVESRDIVYVSASSIARWNRLVSNLLPSVTGFGIFDRAVAK